MPKGQQAIRRSVDRTDPRRVAMKIWMSPAQAEAVRRAAARLRKQTMTWARAELLTAARRITGGAAHG